jgi:2-oxoglutarate ferredoxin oxidoreductase subunit gamma
MQIKEIKIGGFGGQGVILSAHILGKAASIFDDKFATMIQSFGPEARGSACSAQVIISDKVISYPYVVKPKILVVMSQEAFKKFEPEMDDDGILLTESELIQIGDLRPGIKHYSIPSTRIAEELGKKLILNIVMVGFFTSITGILSKTAVAKAVETSVPKGTEELNLKAFNQGFEYGIKLLKKL